MDKRESVRVPVHVRAQCHTQGVVIEGLVEDVSRSGLFLRAVKFVRAGSAAEIDVEVDGEEPLRLTAEVVRVDSSRTGMGLRFVEQADMSRGLANFIMRSHATTR